MRARAALVGLALALVPLAARADVATIIWTIITYAEVATGLTIGTLLTVATVAVNVYGASSARRKQRRAAAAARAEYNASLQDRSITVLRSDPPWQVVYGRTIVGGAVHDIFTTDATGVRREDGSTYTKADALKHIVIRIASHECAAVHQVYVDGIGLGTLTFDGYPTNPDFLLSDNESRTASFTGTYTAPELPLSILQAYAADGSGAVTVTISGNDLIGPSGVAIVCDYLVQALDYSVRVSISLGSPTQAVNAYLHALDPARYTTNHRLRGICYAVVTLNLLDPRFQGGLPNITFDVAGALVYDPRTLATAWSANPALCARDFIVQPWGMDADPADVDDATVIAAANACDTLITLEVGATTETNQPLYTCNGSFTTEQAPEAVLDDLAESMAGDIYQGAQWVVSAGVWTPPVLALGDDDLHGQIELVQADTPMSELFNGVRSQYIKAGATAPSEPEPYSNAVFVAADGRELWDDVAWPFTDHPARLRNLMRVRTERNRSGQVIRYPAKLKAWPLQVGDRVTVTSAEYGLSAKAYRVTDWQFEITGPVVLTLQEDDASIYDLADAATEDPTPNSGLPNPWLVDMLTGLAAASGDTHLLTTADGTVEPRVRVTWNAVTDAAVVNGGAIEVQWRGGGETAWRDVPPVAGAETGTYITGAKEGDRLLIRARARNVLRAVAVWEYVTHLVQGKSGPPSDVTGLAYAVKPYQVVLGWNACPDADYAETELRVGASWAAGTMLWRGKGNDYKHARPPNGIYEVWACHLDTSGNYSTTPASVTVAVDDSIADGAGTLYLTTDRFPYFSFADGTTHTASGGGSADITFTATLDDLTGSPVFVLEAFDSSDASLGTMTLTGTGLTRTLTAADFVSLGSAGSVRYADVTATLANASDYIRVYRQDPTITDPRLYLSNPMHTVATAADGTGGDYSGATTDAVVFVGITDSTASFDFSITPDAGIAATINGGAGPITGASTIAVAVSDSAVNNGVVLVEATDGVDDLAAAFRVRKSLAGATAYQHYLEPLQSITLPVDQAGNVTSYAAAWTNAVVLKGTTNDTSAWTITKTDRNVTSTLVGAKVSITSMLEPGTFSSTTNVGPVAKPTGYTGLEGWITGGALLYDGAAWVRTGHNNSGTNGYHHVQRSTDDCATWSNVDLGVADCSWSTSAAMDGRMLLLGRLASGAATDRALVSTDGGLTWSAETMPGSHVWYFASGGDNFIVARNGSTTAYRSPTGVTGSWTSVTMPTTSSKPCYIAPGRWAAVDASGGIHTSADGCATWTNRTGVLGLAGNYVNQAHGFRGLIVAFFQNSTTRIAVSADNGATWVNVTAAAAYSQPKAVRTIRDVLYMVGTDGKVHWTADGYKWRHSGQVVSSVGGFYADSIYGNYSGRDLQLDYLLLYGDTNYRQCALAATADGIGSVTLHFAKGSETLPDLTLMVTKAGAASNVYVASANPAAVLFPATSDGVVTDYAPGVVTAAIAYNGAPDTTAWTWSWVASTGITPSSGSTNVATITAMSSSVDTGYIDFTATKAGAPVQTGRIPVSKSKGSEPSGPRTGAAFASFSATDTYIGLRFTTDGRVQVKRGSGGSWVTVTQWALPLSASNGSAYWIRVDTTGHALDGASSATGTWLAMTSDRDYILSDAASGTHYTSLEVAFATSSGGAGAVANVGSLKLIVP